MELFEALVERAPLLPQDEWCHLSDPRNITNFRYHPVTGSVVKAGPLVQLRYMILVKGDLVCHQPSDPQPWTEVGPHHISSRPDTLHLQFWAGAWRKRRH